MATLTSMAISCVSCSRTMTGGSDSWSPVPPSGRMELHSKKPRMRLAAWPAARTEVVVDSVAKQAAIKEAINAAAAAEVVRAVALPPPPPVTNASPLHCFW